ncbi:hypothetical protein [Phormidium sp. CCY1219]|nr:hypothetical protein [Phormidium sp. CCY1219]MEB3829909.1 hypothetical protein [Phormidium sp. CCY1219]
MLKRHRYAVPIANLAGVLRHLPPPGAPRFDEMDIAGPIAQGGHSD